MQTNHGDYEPVSYHIFGLVNYDSLDVMVAAGSRRVSKGVSAISGLSSVKTNINKDNKLITPLTLITFYNAIINLCPCFIKVRSTGVKQKVIISIFFINIFYNFRIYIFEIKK